MAACLKCKSCVSVAESVALSVQKALGLASGGAAVCNVPSSGKKMGSKDELGHGGCWGAWPLRAVSLSWGSCLQASYVDFCSDGFLSIGWVKHIGLFQKARFSRSQETVCSFYFLSWKPMFSGLIDSTSSLADLPLKPPFSFYLLAFPVKAWLKQGNSLKFSELNLT